TIRLRFRPRKQQTGFGRDFGKSWFRPSAKPREHVLSKLVITVQVAALYEDCGQSQPGQTIVWFQLECLGHVHRCVGESPGVDSILRAKAERSETLHPVFCCRREQA